MTELRTPGKDVNLVLYLVGQRYFEQGMILSSLKG